MWRLRLACRAPAVSCSTRRVHISMPNISTTHIRFIHTAATARANSADESAASATTANVTAGGSDGLATLSIDALRSMCDSRGLSRGGTADALRKRLAAATDSAATASAASGTAATGAAPTEIDERASEAEAQEMRWMMQQARMNRSRASAASAPAASKPAILATPKPIKPAARAVSLLQQFENAKSKPKSKSKSTRDGKSKKTRTSGDDDTESVAPPADVRPGADIARQFSRQRALAHSEADAARAASAMREQIAAKALDPKRPRLKYLPPAAPRTAEEEAIERAYQSKERALGAMVRATRDAPMPPPIRAAVDRYLQSVGYYAGTNDDWESRDYGVWYMANRFPRAFSVYQRLFDELSRRMPDFRPTTVLDYASGPASVFSAVQTVWPTQMKNYAFVEKLTKEQHVQVRHATRLSQISLAKLPEPHSLVVAGYCLAEQPPEQLHKLLDDLWARTTDVLVLVEAATEAGFGRIKDARAYLLATYPHPTKPDATVSEAKAKHPQYASVVAPCNHDLTCPGGIKGICSFGQRTPRSALPTRSPLRDMKTSQAMGDVVIDRFSYVVLKKGLSPRYDPRLPRVPLFARPNNAATDAADAKAEADENASDSDEPNAAFDDQTPTTKINPVLTDLDITALAWRFERAVSQPVKRNRHVMLDVCTTTRGHPFPSIEPPAPINQSATPATAPASNSFITLSDDASGGATADAAPASDHVRPRSGKSSEAVGIYDGPNTGIIERRVLGKQRHAAKRESDKTEAEINRVARAAIAAGVSPDEVPRYVPKPKHLQKKYFFESAERRKNRLWIGREMYSTVRKLRWGDLWPFTRTDSMTSDEFDAMKAVVHRDRSASAAMLEARRRESRAARKEELKAERKQTKRQQLKGFMDDAKANKSAAGDENDASDMSDGDAADATSDDPKQYEVVDALTSMRRNKRTGQMEIDPSKALADPDRDKYKDESDDEPNQNQSDDDSDADITPVRRVTRSRDRNAGRTVDAASSSRVDTGAAATADRSQIDAMIDAWEASGNRSDAKQLRAMLKDMSPSEIRKSLSSVASGQVDADADASDGDDADVAAPAGGRRSADRNRSDLVKANRMLQRMSSPAAAAVGSAKADLFKPSAIQRLRRAAAATVDHVDLNPSEVKELERLSVMAKRLGAMGQQLREEAAAAAGADAGRSRRSRSQSKKSAASTADADESDADIDPSELRKLSEMAKELGIPPPDFKNFSDFDDATRPAEAEDEPEVVSDRDIDSANGPPPPATGPGGSFGRNKRTRRARGERRDARR